MIVLAVANWLVLAYFLALNSTYVVLIAVAAVDVPRQRHRTSFADREDAYASPLTMSISVLLPAYNEELSIVESVRAVLALRYPVFEVVVVDDGSTDGTFDALQEAFDLRVVPRVVPDDVEARGAILSVHAPSGPAPLVVVRKANGGKTSAVNAGINVSRHALICIADSDSLLDAEALLSVSKPFVDDPERVVATGGVVRAVNGCGVAAGRVVDVRMPPTMLARIQVVEYLRAFLLGRTAWSAMGALVIISGAFGLFRRDVVVEVGGLDHDTLGEDAELVVRMHRHLRATRRPYRMVFVAEPVCWTEVPENRAVLGRQRRRWSRGLAETLWKHRSMIFSPRQGAVGMLALPFYLVFELLAPLVEVFGLVALGIALLLGAVDWSFAALFALVAVVYGILLSLAALSVEELSFHRYRRWRDLGAAVTAAVVENLGYRQLTAVWRLLGLWDVITRRTPSWGKMERVGFTAATPAVVPAALYAAPAGPVPESGPVVAPVPADDAVLAPVPAPR